MFREGTHGRLYQKFGCQLGDGMAVFSVWAPNAESVSVIGDFNQWRPDANVARPRSDGTGIWQVEIPGVEHGHKYKFAIRSRSGELLEKADPFARYAELAPNTGSIVWRDSEYDWQDADWMANRPEHNGLASPMSVYEVHLGSWKRDANGEMLG
ncbi:MAG: 1,4-alpha-glucan branching enzyme, partial [Burkholderiales bacterium]